MQYFLFEGKDFFWNFLSPKWSSFSKENVKTWFAITFYFWMWNKVSWDDVEFSKQNWWWICVELLLFPQPPIIQEIQESSCYFLSRHCSTQEKVKHYKTWKLFDTAKKQDGLECTFRTWTVTLFGALRRNIFREVVGLI